MIYCIQTLYLLLPSQKILMDPVVETLFKKQLPIVIKQVTITLKQTKRIDFAGFYRLQKMVQQHGSFVDEIIGLHTFAFYISQIPGVWADLFEHEQIHSPSRTIQLGDYIYAFHKSFQSKLSQSKLHQEFYKITKIQIDELILTCSLQLVDCFNRSKNFLFQKMSQIKNEDKKVQYMNKYIAFKILREISHQCNKQIKNIILPLFERVEPQIFQRFIKWIIKKHEHIQLRMEKSIKDWQVSRIQQTREEFQNQLHDYLKRSNENSKGKISYSKAVRQDGKPGLLVVRYITPKFGFKYFVFNDQFDSFAVMNGALMTLKWKSKQYSENIISSQDEGGFQYLLSQKEQISDLLLSQSIEIHHDESYSGVQNIQGALSHFLANFKEYKSIQKFVEDFTKRPIVNSGVKFLIGRIPYVGQAMQTLGFFQQFSRVIFNDYETNKHRLNDLKVLFVQTLIYIAGAVLGYYIGEVLIPVPVLGSLIGGTVATLLVNYFTKKYDAYQQKKRLNRIYRGLKKEMRSEGWWQHDKRILYLFQMKPQYFVKTVPYLGTNDDKSLWLTALCFFVMSFFQCKKQQELISKREKLFKNQKAKVSNIQKDQNKQSSYAKEFSHLQISGDLQKCLFYLQHKNFKIKDHLEQLTDLLIKVLKL